MYELDFRLEGHHVVRPVPVDQVDERRNQGGLATETRAGHDDQPVPLIRKSLNVARQAQLIGRNQPGGDQPEYGTGPAGL